MGVVEAPAGCWVGGGRGAGSWPVAGKATAEIRMSCGSHLCHSVPFVECPNSRPPDGHVWVRKSISGGADEALSLCLNQGCGSSPKCQASGP